MDFRKIVTDSAVSTLRTLLFTGRRLLVIPLLTKLIDVGSYGFWATSMGLVLLFAKIGGLQMSNALIRYTSQETDEAGTFGGTFLVTLFGALLAAAGFMGFAVLTGFLEQASVPTAERDVLLATIAMMVFARTLFGYLSNYPRALNRVKEFEAIQLIELAFEVLAIAVTLYVTRSVVWGMVALVTVLVVTDIGLLVRYVGTSISVPSQTRIRKYVSYSFPLIFKGVSAMLLANADKFLVLYLLSPAAAGVYAAAYTICGVFRSLSSVLNPTLYPAVSAAWDDGEMADLRSLYRGVLMGYTILALPALVGLTLVAPSFIRLLSTEAVGDGATVLVPVIGVGLLFRAYEGPLSYILKADERTTVLGAVVVLAATVNLALNVLLIPSLELMGAAIATLVSEVLIFGVVFWYARSLVKLVMPLRVVVKTLLASALMAAVLLAVPIDRTTIQYLLVAPPLGVGVYFAVMFVTGGFPDALADRVRAVVQ